MKQLSILVIAASSARRARLTDKITRASSAIITTASGISTEGILQAETDIVLVDVDSSEVASAALQAMQSLPGGTGSVILADNPDLHWVGRVLSAGVNAVLAREITDNELHLAILAAEAGLVLLHPTSALGLAPLTLQQLSDLPDVVEALTAREQEVLRLMSEGLGNKAIAVRLNISEHTVKFHISSILGKLNVNSRTEAVSLGIRRGIIPI
ncbi:MAG TPA: response regulator transcription factor [Candidatus Solibacter sp.]|jgi:NarL family two-component system response regulator YdfI|nr:response regulator transcription factor [Candidatus Solibacter sp.]